MPDAALPFTPRALREQQAAEAKERALAALAELTADLLRLITGAGKGHSITQHAGEFVAAVAQHQAAVGTGLSVNEVRASLMAGLPDCPDQETRRRPLDERNEDRALTVACLRIAAARLLGQLSAEHAPREMLASTLRGRDDRIRRRK